MLNNTVIMFIKTHWAKGVLTRLSHYY